MAGHQTGYIMDCSQQQLTLFVCIFYFVWKCGVWCQNSLIYVITTNETMESEAGHDDEVDDENGQAEHDLYWQ